MELVYLAVTRGQHNRLVQIMSFIAFHSGGPAYVLNSQADADGPVGCSLDLHSCKFSLPKLYSVSVAIENVSTRKRSCLNWLIVQVSLFIG